ncbi:MAG: DUF1905 domain-containing protein [Acidimicrobiia bacterium]
MAINNGGRELETVRFQTTLRQAEGKQATGLIVPVEVIEQLGHGQKPPVRASINGHEFRTTVGVMGGLHMIGVSAAIRSETGLAAGDTVEVELTVDTSPREVEIPDDLAEAFAAQPEARDFFSTLSNSLQRYHVDNINAAKAAETRQRRIDKAISLFLAKKPR